MVTVLAVPQSSGISCTRAARVVEGLKLERVKTTRPWQLTPLSLQYKAGCPY